MGLGCKTKEAVLSERVYSRLENADGALDYQWRAREREQDARNKARFIAWRTRLRFTAAA